MPRPWIVLKFGGTSVATAARWERIAARADQGLAAHRVWIVASALAGVSNALERAVKRALEPGSPREASLQFVREAHRVLASELAVEDPTGSIWEELDRLLEGIHLTGEAPPRLIARVMAAGELASTRLGVLALARAGLSARWVDARELLESDSRPSDPAESRFLSARVMPSRAPERVDSIVGESELVLTQGFIACTHEGETCLLGRGGSDTSASLFGALLDASEVEIWTDVHGLFTADPRRVPEARLIHRVGYREAQELAAMGAKVLHPRCLEPVAWAGIPLSVHCTDDPDAPGTRVEATDEEHPAVTAVTCRTGVTLLSLSTFAMWGAPGFLSRAFAPFEELGISVDLVATSEAAVTVTLDGIPGGTTGPACAALIERLERLGTVKVVHPCAVISIVGRRIRTVLHELAPALEVFQERPVHLLSQSSEDLNLSFVVEEADAEALLVQLHRRLFPPQAVSSRLGSTWEVLQGARPAAKATWWRARRQELLELASNLRPRYVYDLATMRQRARELRDQLSSVGGFYYAMKANEHPAILRALAETGFGFECVSPEELRRAREMGGARARLLFTPNFCAMDEYALAFELGAEVTIDGPQPLGLAPALFAGREIALRIDPGRGLGHHEKVRTAGAQAKFGQPLDQIDELLAAARAVNARVVGLHAHVGSGIFDPESWARTGSALASLAMRIPSLRWIDPGGGLGVPERPGQLELDLARLETNLAALRRALGTIELRLEPGRYLVSEAGVLLLPVTQTRRKGGVGFIGVATGMNSLIRPALYGAWHGLHNLTRLDAEPSGYWNVVRPICESSDVLGRDRLLPEAQPGDVLLLENAGAYGAAMASNYNLRPPAEEWILE